MRVSVVICTHTPERYESLREATASVRAQTHADVELVLVSDGDREVYERVRADYGDRDDVIVHEMEQNRGLAASRNAGADLATGDVVAFLDDDAIADEEWIARLVEAYESADALAAGGRMTPAWVAGKPDFLPEEFYWLVGVTHRGFADAPGEVRNTFGSNISFRADVFEELGGFDPDILGRRGGKNLQAEEPELCARLRREYGRGVYYDPEATVAHKVFDYRTDPRWLLNRAFWQGYSKRVMADLVPESTGAETGFLGMVVRESIPERIAGLFRGSRTDGLQLLALVGFTAAVGAGYLYGLLTRRT